MSDIFFEVKESIEKEKIQKLWKMLRYPIIGLSIALVIGVGVYEYFLSKSLKKSAIDQSIYSMALKDLKAKDINSCLNRLDHIIANGSAGYVQLALMLKAGLLNAMKDYERRDIVYSELSSKYKNIDSFISCCAFLSRISDLGKAHNREKLKLIVSNKSDPMRGFAMQLLLFWDIINGLNKDAQLKMNELRNIGSSNIYLLGMLNNIIGD